MAFVLDFFLDNYPQILIGMLVFQCVSMFLQFLITKDKAFLYYSINLLLGIYVCVNEFNEVNIIQLYKGPDHLLISVTCISLIFYWLFFLVIFNIRKDDLISKRIIYTAIIVYIFIFVFENFLKVFDLSQYPLLVRLSAIFTYIPMVLSVVLYVRIYKYYDISIAKYVIIGSLIGDLFITPIQYFMSMGIEAIRFPFFSLSYLMESVFFFLALSKRQRVIKDQNISLEQSLFLSRHAALRAQMNPHFFNNVLNAINKFILNHENETASYYLTKFSRLMRDILNQSRLDVIDLKTEVETLNKYIEMEALRFSKQFEYQIETDPNIDLQKVFIPPMLIQPFVENAINHGLLKKKGIRLLKISISQVANFVEIVVEDNGVGFNANLISEDTSNNNPHGISIVKERIQQNNSENIITLLPIQSSSSGTKIVLRLH